MRNIHMNCTFIFMEIKPIFIGEVLREDSEKATRKCPKGLAALNTPTYFEHSNVWKHQFSNIYSPYGVMEVFCDFKSFHSAFQQHANSEVHNPTNDCVYCCRQS